MNHPSFHAHPTPLPIQSVFSLPLYNLQNWLGIKSQWFTYWVFAVCALLYGISLQFFFLQFFCRADGEMQQIFFDFHQLRKDGWHRDEELQLEADSFCVFIQGAVLYKKLTAFASSAKGQYFTRSWQLLHLQPRGSILQEADSFCVFIQGALLYKKLTAFASSSKGRYFTRSWQLLRLHPRGITLQEAAGALLSAQAPSLMWRQSMQLGVVINSQH